MLSSWISEHAGARHAEKTVHGLRWPHSAGWVTHGNVNKVEFGRRGRRCRRNGKISWLPKALWSGQEPDDHLMAISRCAGGKASEIDWRGKQRKE